jgi:hypothetical protein
MPRFEAATAQQSKTRVAAYRGPAGALEVSRGSSFRRYKVEQETGL